MIAVGSRGNGKPPANHQVKEGKTPADILTGAKGLYPDEDNYRVLNSDHHHDATGDVAHGRPPFLRVGFRQVTLPMVPDKGAVIGVSRRS